MGPVHPVFDDVHTPDQLTSSPTSISPRQTTKRASRLAYIPRAILSPATRLIKNISTHLGCRSFDATLYPFHRPTNTHPTLSSSIQVQINHHPSTSKTPPAQAPAQLKPRPFLPLQTARPNLSSPPDRVIAVPHLHLKYPSRRYLPSRPN